MDEMSPEVDRALRAAGWEPGRREDISDWELMYWNSGLEFHPAAREFVTEFGGLLVESDGSDRRRRLLFSLDPDDACGDERTFRDWSADLGRQLYPIGSLSLHRFSAWTSAA